MSNAEVLVHDFLECFSYVLKGAFQICILKVDDDIAGYEAPGRRGLDAAQQAQTVRSCRVQD